MNIAFGLMTPPMTSKEDDLLPEAGVTVWRRLSEDITERRGPAPVIIQHLSLATAGQLTPGHWHTSDQVLAVAGSMHSGVLTS